MRECKPSSFLDIAEDRLQGDLDCLATLGERDLILAIAAVYGAAASRDAHPRRLLLLAAACVAIGAEDRATALLSSLEPRPRAAKPLGRLAGIYAVRELFPPHWSRRDEAGLVRVLKPSVMGRPSEHAVTLPLPFQGCVAIERVRVFGEFNILDENDNLVVYDHAGHPRLPEVAGQALEVRGTPLAMIAPRSITPTTGEADCHPQFTSRDVVAPNYFHWIVEYLPRILTAIEASVDQHAKLLIPANMAGSMRRALDIVNAGHFPVHEFASRDLLEVDRLFVPALQSCIVDGRALPLSHIERFRRVICDLCASESCAMSRTTTVASPSREKCFSPVAGGLAASVPKTRSARPSRPKASSRWIRRSSDLSIKSIVPRRRGDCFCKRRRPDKPSVLREKSDRNCVDWYAQRGFQSLLERAADFRRRPLFACDGTSADDSDPVGE